jgi:GNAT superfamily N-acetyltransferase
MTTQFILLSKTDAPALAELTFPHYRSLLVSSDTDVVALAAVKEGEAIALVLACPREAKLLSLYVTALHRHQGVGRGLLAALETELARRGCRDVCTVWMSSAPGAEAFAALLRGQGWSRQQARMVIYRAEFARLGEASWLHAFASLPAGHAIVPWSDLEPEQLIKLRQAIRFEGWVPSDLVPFDFADKGIDGALPEQKLNLACIVWGDVVGWNFAHRIDAQTIRVSCTFVRPDLQQQLVMLALWREAFVRMADTEYRTMSWAVSVGREAMLNFNDKYMTPYLSRRSESWESRKVLTPHPLDVP